MPSDESKGSQLDAIGSLAQRQLDNTMLADWIGSDAHQSAFPYSEDRDFDRISFARDRARHILETMGIANEAARRSVKGRDAFRAIAPNFSPRSAQRGMMEIGVPTKASLSVLEAETGSGKTEAALANFVELFAAGEVDGLVFALPTRSAATQISLFADSETFSESWPPSGSMRSGACFQRRASGAPHIRRRVFVLAWRECDAVFFSRTRSSSESRLLSARGDARLARDRPPAGRPAHLQTSAGEPAGSSPGDDPGLSPTGSASSARPPSTH